MLAVVALQELTAFDSRAQARRNVLRAVEAVAGRLGTTPAICRKSYVDPAMICAYLEGPVTITLKARAESEITSRLNLSGVRARPTWPRGGEQSARGRYPRVIWT